MLLLDGARSGGLRIGVLFRVDITRRARRIVGGTRLRVAWMLARAFGVIFLRHLRIPGPLSSGELPLCAVGGIRDDIPCHVQARRSCHRAPRVEGVHVEPRIHFPFQLLGTKPSILAS